MIYHVASLASLPEETISTIMKSDEYDLFLKSVNQGRVNEHRFHMLAALMTRQLQKKPNPSVIYVAGGHCPLFSRHKVDKENQPTSTSLKIYFFTTKIKWDDETKAFHSDCTYKASSLGNKSYPEF